MKIIRENGNYKLMVGERENDEGKVFQRKWKSAKDKVWRRRASATNSYWHDTIETKVTGHRGRLTMNDWSQLARRTSFAFDLIPFQVSISDKWAKLQGTNKSLSSSSSICQLKWEDCCFDQWHWITRRINISLREEGFGHFFSKGKFRDCHVERKTQKKRKKKREEMSVPRRRNIESNLGVIT